MKVIVEDGFTVVSDIRLFDHKFAQQFAAEVTCNVGDSLPKFVIVDLSDTTGVLSAAIVELISLTNALSAGNGLLVLSGLSDPAKAALKAAGIDDFFTTCPDVPEAKEELRRQMEV